jgi:hypothetical protein
MCDITDTLRTLQFKSDFDDKNLTRGMLSNQILSGIPQGAERHTHTHTHTCTHTHTHTHTLSLSAAVDLGLDAKIKNIEELEAKKDEMRAKREER